MKNKTVFIFIFLFLISLVLRIVNFDKFPPSPNWDEVSLGYNSYSILKTGKDEWGKLFPMIFRAYGDFKLPVYIYFSIPFISLLGLNILSVRLLSVIAGSILPIIIFLIIQKIFPKQKILPFLGCLIVVFSPCFIFLSRIALEANLFLLFFCISILFLIKSNFSLSSFFYGLCLFTYNSSRVLLPFYLILLVFLIIKAKYKIAKNWWKFLFLFLTVFVFLMQTLNQTGQARYKWVSLIDSGAINQINELQNKYSRIFFNKITYFVFSASKNYIAHFNPQYLFFDGGSNFQFNIPNFYLISPLFLPFFIIGFIVLLIQVFKKFDQNFLIILFWLLIAPIPSAITRDAPHILRSIVFLPAIIIIIAFGINQFLLLKKQSFLFFYFFLAILVTQVSFWKKYSQYSQKYSESWQFGYQQIVYFAKNNYLKYDHIFITKKYGEPHEFILFFWPWDPNKYQNDSNKNWNYHADWYWIDAFDKFEFINDWEIKDKTKNGLTGKNLLITSPNNYNQDSKLIKTIFFPDEKKAFDIVETI